MSYRLFRNIGRFLLAACVVSLGVASLNAQSTTAPGEVNPSRVDIFMGYSYYGAHGQVKPANIRYSSIDEGAMLSGAYYFNKYVGAEIVGGFHPDGQNDGMYVGSAGPIFRAPMQNFTLFAHGLVGGANLAGPNSEVPSASYHEPYRWGASVAVGGGMDYDLPFFNHRFGLRLFQADYRYIHESYGPSTPIGSGGILGGRANLSGVELSTGLLVHFGHIIPPHVLEYACAVTAPTGGSIYPGDPVTITGTATYILPNKTPSYSWSADGGATASSTSNVVTIDTKSLAPGTYTVKGHVSDGTKPGRAADCSAPFTLNTYAQPTVACSATPPSIEAGSSSMTFMVSASGTVDPHLGSPTYSYSASSGTIAASNSNSTTLDATGVAPGTINITCNVVDSKGQTATNTTSVMITPKPAPDCHATNSCVIPTVPQCTITFENPKQPPYRVDNEAKACLDKIALNAQHDPSAKLVIVGTASASEKMGPKLAKERAVNTKAYLTSETVGIDASRITVYTGTADSKSAATTLVPTGATLDMTGLTPVDESTVKVIPRSAPMKKDHKK